MGQAMQGTKSALPLLVKIDIHAWIGIRCTMFEHMIDDASDLMRCGRDSHGSPMFGFDATIEGTECTLRTMDRLCSKAKSGSRSVGGRTSVTTEDLPRRRLIIGSQA